jgi:uncharacterized protein (TIGR02266 family)
VTVLTVRTPRLPMDRVMVEERIETAIRTDFETGEVKANGQIKNVGEGGLFVRTPSIPEAGDKVELSFDSPNGQRVEVAGVVWWTTDDREAYQLERRGFGVRLVNAGEAYRALLQRLRHQRGTLRR